MQTLIKNSGFISTYLVGGKEVQNIRIYDKTGVLFKTSSGWFERKEYPNRVTGFVLPEEPKRKNKEDFNFVGAYTMKYAPKYGFEHNYCYLYVHASLVKYEALGERILFAMDTHNSYSNFANITIDCITQEVKHVEKTHKNDFSGIEYYDSEIHPLTLEVHAVCHRSEDTNFGAKVKELEAELKEKSIKISGYELEQLMKEYEITPRKKKLKTA